MLQTLETHPVISPHMHYPWPFHPLGHGTILSSSKRMKVRRLAYVSRLLAVAPVSR